MLYGATGSHGKRRDWPAAFFAMLVGTQVALASLHGGRHCARIIEAHMRCNTPPIATPAAAAEEATSPQAAKSNPRSNGGDAGQPLSVSHLPNVSSQEAPLFCSRPPDPIHPPQSEKEASQSPTNAVDSPVDSVGPPPLALLIPCTVAALFLVVIALVVLVFWWQWLQVAEVLLSVALAPAGALLRWQLSILNSAPQRAHLPSTHASTLLHLTLIAPHVEVVP